MGPAAIDRFGLLRYVPDGTCLEISDKSIAFMGGVDATDTKPAIFNHEAYTRLIGRKPQTIDLLITHDCPWGIAEGFNGQTQGSALITKLLDQLQPEFHVAGHYHISVARTYGRTKFLCLSNIMASAKWHPEIKGICPGWLAVIDTSSNSLMPINEAVITGIEQPSWGDM
jgi:hypothetical protein